eukprot:3972571-Heterocapsa_arctica.AAC.1
MLNNAANVAEQAWTTAADEASQDETARQSNEPMDTDQALDDEDDDEYDNEDPISPHASPLQNAISKAMDKHRI